MSASRVAQVAIAVGMVWFVRPVMGDECFDLREFAFQQSPWGQPNTVIYAQSVKACSDRLSEVSMRAVHDGGGDILFNVLVTRTRDGS